MSQLNPAMTTETSINNSILTPYPQNKKSEQQHMNMQEGMINMDTIDAMMNDGDLINLQSKYINICWSILAIGTVIFTIANIKN
jgi:hypothetical protein